MAAPNAIVATKRMLWEGRQLEAGDVVPPGRRLRGKLRVLLGQGHVAHLREVEVRYIALRRLFHHGKRLEPGKLLPKDVVRWPTFGRLRDNGFIGVAPPDAEKATEKHERHLRQFAQPVAGGRKKAQRKKASSRRR